MPYHAPTETGRSRYKFSHGLNRKLHRNGPNTDSTCHAIRLQQFGPGHGSVAAPWAAKRTQRIRGYMLPPGLFRKRRSYDSLVPILYSI